MFEPPILGIYQRRSQEVCVGQSVLMSHGSATSEMSASQPDPVDAADMKLHRVDVVHTWSILRWMLQTGGVGDIDENRRFPSSAAIQAQSLLCRGRATHHWSEDWRVRALETVGHCWKFFEFSCFATVPRLNSWSLSKDIWWNSVERNFSPSFARNYWYRWANLEGTRKKLATGSQFEPRRTGGDQVLQRGKYPVEDIVVKRNLCRSYYKIKLPIFSILDWRLYKIQV